jgi:HSP20 family molecular chaperone IbpA
MADPEPRAPEVQARTSRTPDRSNEPSGGRGAAPEQRVFDTSDRAVEAGTETARDFARTGADASRSIAETGARTLERSADLWRQSMLPLGALPIEMNRLFDEMWRGAMSNFSSSPFAGASGGLMQGLMGQPSADLHETRDGYHLSVELAGMRPQDVEVTLDGDDLVVSGEKHDQHRDDRSGFRVNERRFGRFERRFHLPRDADR